MGSVAYEPEALAFDPSPLFSQRVQRWEPGASKPNPDTFPFSKISITVNGPEEKTLVLDGTALSEALQYGPPAGHPGLLKWFQGLQQAVHGISNSDSWTCCVGNGSQEIIHKAFQVFTDPGDSVMLETLALAKRFNFMIFEDDAYFFLNFEQDQSKRARSYLALEQEVNGETGRVMRFESLSKIVSSGMRLQPSSTTQVLALTLFRHWGYTGFVEHCAKAAEFYQRKRDAFAAAADRHLQGRATWEVPTAGMFFWLKLLLPSGTDSFEILSKKGIDNKILAIPGMAFLPNARKACQLRASYSLVSDSDMDEACRRIAKLVDDAWREEFANSAKHEAQAPVPTTTMKITA
ncbi:hypothetical protein CHGG_03686 [Chaetomium globosum CBS 148.51]|uniref:Aminotransferase class I/classII domain-containing protein n=1 Tax=Chaetomium globosum (strain ATCC 6205 / CBS 148.51 / DSM 1962 / NBRC 6347 / NRRL 1970) TaxID=306901 RepID=Q2H7W8_CHAGB|nr:uncharacterized protein CHGG_03686 [Chaetomium globosum CBS 148.51]EAQ91751.1 hypothetical protein CHGG_03686 [Chaetomium globosum CBS 148.51]